MSSPRTRGEMCHPHARGEVVVFDVLYIGFLALFTAENPISWDFAIYICESHTSTLVHISGKSWFYWTDTPWQKTPAYWKWENAYKSVTCSMGFRAV